MLEAVEYILSQRNVVLVILDIQAGMVIDGIEIDERQRKDLNRARAFLCDIAARHQKYCDVFDSVENVSPSTRKLSDACVNFIPAIDIDHTFRMTFALVCNCSVCLIMQAIAHICFSHRSMTPRTHSNSFVSPTKSALAGSFSTTAPAQTQ